MKNATVYELTLESGTFEALIRDFDAITNRTFHQMQKLDLDEAEVTVKVKITTENRMVSEPSQDDLNAKRTAVVPKFEHTVTSALKIKDEEKGSLSGKFELIYDEDTGKFVLVDIVSNQTSMFDQEDAEEDEGGMVYQEGTVPPALMQPAPALYAGKNEEAESA